jgi:hypothetical protein
MTLVLSVLLFTVVGFALSRFIGPMSWYLGGTGAVGTVIFVAGVARIPITITAVSLLIIATAVALTAARNARPRRAWREDFTPAIPTLAMAIAAAALLFIAAITPTTDYDGRAFWLMKAKAIAHERAIDGPFFQGMTTVNSRNEYPLLLPIDAALLMGGAGELDERHTRWFYVFFAIAFALEVRRRFSTWFSPAIGAWSGAILLWLPQIAIDPEGGVLSAYSDVALGAFAACAFFELIDQKSPLRFGLWLAFVMLTKSEGLPLAAVLFAVGVFVFRRRIVTAVVPFAASFAALLIWRGRVERSDELDFARLVFTVPEHTTQYVRSLSVYVRQIITQHDWGFFWLAVVIAAIVLLLRRQLRPVLLCAAVVLPMVLLYAAVFSVSGWELAVLSDNLAPRTLTHLLGPGLYVLAAGVSLSGVKNHGD